MQFRKILIVGFTIAISSLMYSQSYVNTLRGTVKDQITQQPLAYVQVILSDSIMASTDDNGEFRFDGLRLGKYTLALQYVGYENVLLRNIQVNTGKETIINAVMEESVQSIQEVVVSSNKEKAKPLNEMSLLSTRMVSVEETQRYAASFNDPARMANSFAGVVQTDAGNNHITIRGNAPNGLLWRLEGIDIPNPNHFAYVSTSGGGVSILSGQLLSNSDFATGAFAAEYGNALSGVFDIKLRKGNNEKREYTFQIGALGIDVAAEGPFKKGSKNAYLVNYRYSTLGLLSKAKIIDIGGSITTFQDLSYNLSFKNKKWGDITLFGLNGLSSQNGQDTTFDQHIDFVSNTIVNGMTHSKTLGINSFLRTAIVLSNTQNSVLINENDSLRGNASFVAYDENHRHDKVTFSSKFQHKLNANTSLKIGIIHSTLKYKVRQLSKEDLIAPEEVLYRQQGATSLSQFYVQIQHKFSNRLTANIGLHTMYNWLNARRTLEPRAAIQYSISPRQSMTLGYGLHSQMLPLSTYFVQTIEDETIKLVNKDLGMSQAHHIVFGYSIQPMDLLNIKAEAYYQSLFNVPQGLVKEDNISLVNLEFGTPDIALENKGIGRNYGVEITVEKYLNQGLYFTFTNSIYDSKFKGTNGLWYNTRFNGNFATTFTGGKEFSLSKKKNRIMSINVKVIYTGGLRQNPIDLEKSIEKNATVFDTSNPYTLQMKNFLRTDVKLAFKRNYKHMTTSLVFDIQNVGNVQNINGQYYNPKSKNIANYTQVGLLPIISYKIEF